MIEKFWDLKQYSFNAPTTDYAEPYGSIGAHPGEPDEV